MIYLASPYSHPDPFIREQRYLAVMKVLGDMLANRQWAYSPIVHCHELKKVRDLPPGHEFWLEYDFHILNRCGVLVVVPLEGWMESKGVAAEIAEANRAQIPVYHYDLKSRSWAGAGRKVPEI